MNRAELDAALAAILAAHRGTSDVNLTAGKPPQVEAHGELKDVALGSRSGPLDPELTRQVMECLTGGSVKLREDLERAGSCDLAHALADGTRFRVNIFRARGQHSIVLRVLASQVPSLESLDLPPILEEIPKLRNGMVLVTGATGSGKSTTLASIIDRLNSSRAVHIVTLEDPVEFVHPHKKATVNQREQGEDFGEFSDGLRAALRQAPKVILVGEMRDRETMEIGLKAAETGHLVLSTLHTINAGQTIERIVGMFEVEERQLIRSRLAQVLHFIVGQRLLPKLAGGRVAALEIMGNNLRVRELILSGETTDKTFYQIISETRHAGWQTFDQHIVDLVAQGKISIEVAKSYCSDVSTVTREIDKLKASRGESTSDLGELEMAYVRKKR